MRKQCLRLVFFKLNTIDTLIKSFIYSRASSLLHVTVDNKAWYLSHVPYPTAHSGQKMYAKRWRLLF